MNKFMFMVSGSATVVADAAVSAAVMPRQPVGLGGELSDHIQPLFKVCGQTILRHKKTTRILFFCAVVSLAFFSAGCESPSSGSSTGTPSTPKTPTTPTTPTAPSVPADTKIVFESGANFTTMLTSLKNQAVEGGSYKIEFKANASVAPQDLSFGGKTVNITITSDSVTARTITLSENGSLFAVGNKVTLTLENNVKLQGKENNTASLVKVESGGKLVMKEGSTISGNTTTVSGGGVHVKSNGTFTMEGGTISGNITNGSSNSSSNYGYGGGVWVNNGTFTIKGGTISGNTANHGGGVCVADAYLLMPTTFTKTGGIICGNETSIVTTLRNTAPSDTRGHAVFYSTNSKYRNTTIPADEEFSIGSGKWDN